MSDPSATDRDDYRCVAITRAGSRCSRGHSSRDSRLCGVHARQLPGGTTLTRPAPLSPRQYRAARRLVAELKELVAREGLLERRLSRLLGCDLDARDARSDLLADAWFDFKWDDTQELDILLGRLGLAPPPGLEGWRPDPARHARTTSLGVLYRLARRLLRGAGYVQTGQGVAGGAGPGAGDPGGRGAGGDAVAG